MISLDQVHVLEKKVESAVSKIIELKNENTALKNRISILEKENTDLNSKVSVFEREQISIAQVSAPGISKMLRGRSSSTKASYAASKRITAPRSFAQFTQV